jgi:hypothetical protein
MSWFRNTGLYGTFSQSLSLLFLREKKIEMAIFLNLDSRRLPRSHHFKLHSERKPRLGDRDRCLVEVAPGYRALLTQQMLEM